MIDLGSELREAREEKGISLTEAEKDTRIKECYLYAMERNDWVSLPTVVQMRGFLRNYAAYLDLDVEQVMSRFNQAVRSVGVDLPTPPAAEANVRTADQDKVVFEPREIHLERPIGGPSWLSADIIIGVVLALVVAAIGFGLLRLTADNPVGAAMDGTMTPELTPAVTLDVDGTAQPGVSAEGTPPPVTPTFSGGSGLVTLNLEATEHVWVRVTVDGAIVLEGTMAPDTAKEWQGVQQIMLETPNGAGLKAVVNGQPQDALGERGQVIVRAWGPTGPVTPAPTVAP